MKLSEVLISMLEDYIANGDKNIEICRFTEDSEKRYWATSAFAKDNVFIIGYDIKGKVGKENK